MTGESDTPSTALEQRKRRAAMAGLTYVEDFDNGYTRRRCGTGFTYLSLDGETIDSDRTRGRIEAMVIPPAWEEVWICPNGKGHIQSRGIDEAGRTQYIYHPLWQQASSTRKFDRMHLMAEVLPRIRRRVRKDLSADSLSKDRVVAAVVRLLDKAQLRVGNPQYAKQRGTRGATTIEPSHVDLDDSKISLEFPGKSGKLREVTFSDRKTAEVIDACVEADNDIDFLFCYREEGGEPHPVSSANVNEYLKEVSGEAITAKDFRTWWGSVIALSELSSQLETDADLSATDRKKEIVAAVAETADELGNTAAVCKSSYIHPGILAAMESGELADMVAKLGQDDGSVPEMTIDETKFTNLLPHLEFT